MSGPVFSVGSAGAGKNGDTPLGRNRKKKGLPVHGWLNVDKPSDITSTQVVGILKRLFNAQKVGHGGTLDPLADGILPIAFGEATKTVQWAMDAEKEYVFTIRWGISTASQDAEGEATATSDARPTREAVEELLKSYVGTIEQVPPKYSAIKVDGQRAYDLAREGEDFEMKSRRVTIVDLVLEDRPDLDSPADLYLEGSDQHRGWFHSSLLQSCATRGRAPYKGVLTHGFVLDEHGRKMSKSLGNVVTPQAVMEQNGADILRLWVVSSDYYNDLRIGPEIIKRMTDTYRRFRNTLRYLLGALDGYDQAEQVGYDDMPDLEKWVLHRIATLDDRIRRMTETYDFHGIFTELHQFCNSDLSAFYFEIRKDMLYCDLPGSTGRRACRTVMHELFNRLTAWLAPIICFTAEEAWQAYVGDPENSVHIRQYDAVPANWRNDEIDANWSLIRQVRQVVMSALEKARNDGAIGASLQAAPQVYVTAAMQSAFDGQDAASLFITSAATIVTDTPPADAFRLDTVADVAVGFAVATGGKCARCWKVMPEVTADDGICKRCGDVVATLA